MPSLPTSLVELIDKSIQHKPFVQRSNTRCDMVWKETSNGLCYSIKPSVVRTVHDIHLTSWTGSVNATKGLCFDNLYYTQKVCENIYVLVPSYCKTTQRSAPAIARLSFPRSEGHQRNWMLQTLALPLPEANGVLPSSLDMADSLLLLFKMLSSVAGIYLSLLVVD